MEVDLVTREDLVRFREILIEDIKALFSKENLGKKQKWIKGKAVREILEISYGSLQNLRITGKLKYTKVGGTYYYLQEEVNRLFDNRGGDESWR